MAGRARELTWTDDPLRVLQRWPAQRPVAMLHSGRPHLQWSRYSLIAEPVSAFRFTGVSRADGRSRWIGQPPRQAQPFTHHPLADTRAVLDADPEALWVGYFAYDLGRWIERLPEHAAADRDWPIIQLQRCPGWLIHDNQTNTWTAHGSYADAPPPLRDEPATRPFTALDEPAPDLPRAEYERRIQRAIDFIAAGDIFQVNLAQRFSVPCRGDARTLFGRLATASPAWYGSHLELLGEPGEPGRVLCSTSPELFLAVDGAEVVTRPIKGTRPASATADELARSPKDAAELHMIVDLMRNDLGRVCDVGSVRVEQARRIESHPTVHHGVATVRGRLHRTMGLTDLLRATMPGGSITGAPKVRAMQIIDQLEPARRGPYCGTIGFLHGPSHRPTARLNIAIRTALLEQPAAGAGRLDFSVGGGIVADSQPEAEYQETLDKAAALLHALRA